MITEDLVHDSTFTKRPCLFFFYDTYIDLVLLFSGIEKSSLFNIY